MNKRLKIVLLLLSGLLLAGLLPAAGCGGEEAVTEAQIADYNKPGVVYVVTTWEADVTLPDVEINFDALEAWLTNEAVSGRVGLTEEELVAALFRELLARPQLYIVAAPTDTVTPMEVTSSGNGFIVSQDGYIVTNAHLVKDDEEELKGLVAEEAAYESFIEQLDFMELVLQQFYPDFQLTEDQALRLIDAVGSVYIQYVTVSDPDSNIQVYTGNIIDAAREREKGLAAETIKVGDPIDIKEETGKDVALLKVNESNLPTVKLGDESSVRDGDRIVAVAYISEKAGESEADQSDVPKEDKPSLVTGTVAGHRTMEGGWDVLQLQIPLKEGSSGSPILNSEGEVVGVETFGTVLTDVETGQETAVEAENYAIPISIAKEYMSQSNVSATEANVMKLYREGIDLFHGEHYKAAKKKFEEVRSANADFPFIQDYISESQANIDKGLDKGTFPIWLLIILIIAVIVAVAVLLVLLLVVLPRSKKGPGPGAGMPGPPPPPAPPQP